MVVNTVLGSHFGQGEFTTHFRTHFSGDWDVHWGYGILTHGHIAMTFKRWNSLSGWGSLAPKVDVHQTAYQISRTHAQKGVVSKIEEPQVWWLFFCPEGPSTS